jgi:hypothetical protein
MRSIQNCHCEEGVLLAPCSSGLPDEAISTPNEEIACTARFAVAIERLAMTPHGDYSKAIITWERCL